MLLLVKKLKLNSDKEKFIGILGRGRTRLRADQRRRRVALPRADRGAHARCPGPALEGAGQRLYAVAGTLAHRRDAREWLIENVLQIWESERPTESDPEGEDPEAVRLQIWQALAEADRRAMVGGYAGAILRLADDMPFQAPVDRVRGGLDGLVEVIPAWGGDGAKPRLRSGTRPGIAGLRKAAHVPFPQRGGSRAELNQVRQFMVHPGPGSGSGRATHITIRAGTTTRRPAPRPQG